jgi:hypothetical protein
LGIAPNDPRYQRELAYYFYNTGLFEIAIDSPDVVIMSGPKCNYEKTFTCKYTLTRRSSADAPQAVDVRIKGGIDMRLEQGHSVQPGSFKLKWPN